MKKKILLLAVLLPIFIFLSFLVFITIKPYKSHLLNTYVQNTLNKLDPSLEFSIKASYISFKPKKLEFLIDFVDFSLKNKKAEHLFYTHNLSIKTNNSAIFSKTTKFVSVIISQDMLSSSLSPSTDRIPKEQIAQLTQLLSSMNLEIQQLPISLPSALNVKNIVIDRLMISGTNTKDGIVINGTFTTDGISSYIKGKADVSNISDVKIKLSASDVPLSKILTMHGNTELADIAISGNIINFQSAHLQKFQITSDSLDINTIITADDNAITLNPQIPHSLGQEVIFQYWPDTLTPDLKAWLMEHLKGAQVKHTNIELRLPFENGVMNKPAQEDIKVSFDIEKANIKYLEHTPEIQNIHATVNISGKSVTIDAKKAEIMGEEILAKATIGPLGQQDISIEIDTALKSSLQKALNIAFQHLQQNEPPSILSQVEGNADSKIHIKVMLGEAHRDAHDNPAILVESDISDVKILNLLDGKYKLEEGAFKAKFINGELQITGSAAINGKAYSAINCNISTNSSKSSIILTSNMDEDTLKSLGFEVRKFMKGSINMSVELSLDSEYKISTGTLHGDLKNTVLTFDALGVGKNKGEKGQFSAELKFSDDMDGVSISNYTLQLPTLSSTGTIQLNEKYEVIELTSKETRLYRSTFNLKYNKAGTSHNIIITGKSLDLGSLDFQKMTKNQDNSDVSLNLKTNVKKIYFKNNVILESPAFTLECVKSVCHNLNLKGTIEGDKKIEISLKKQNLRVYSDDAGHMLAGFGLSSNMREGTLNFTGFLEQNQSNMTGKLEIHNFYMKKAPLLTKLLVISSITSSAFVGPIDLLNNNGIQFKSLTCYVQYKKQSGIDITEGVLKGPVLGMTADGNINLKTETVNIHGVILPENLINTIVNAIPLIGEALSGGKNRGIIGTNYSMKGKIDDVHVSVNPFSILTPGFLREIFSD